MSSVLKRNSNCDVINRLSKGLFDPTTIGLDKDFLLTKLTNAKGCGCKVKRDLLLNLLKNLESNDKNEDNEIGIGLDCAVIPLKYKDMFLIETTDFFYPLVDDPYLQGRVTIANVLSDLFAMGVTECDNVLMLLGVYQNFSDNEREIVIGEFMKGFKDGASIIGTKVRGGQTVKCPWLLIGGTASSVVMKGNFLDVKRAQAGDLLVLTKPIGGQIAVNAYEWSKMNKERIEKLKIENVDNKIIEAYKQACEQMCRLNVNAAILAKKFDAHACTDITGFGILGHADNLASGQRNKVKFVLESIPTIQNVIEISKNMEGGNGFNLFSGTSAETSGGLLIALSPEKAKKFIEEYEAADGFPAWVVGRVEERNDKPTNYAVISDTCNFFETKVSF
uniref:Probable selenide, water dikinase (inferred by orthology to a C. elegans protein) n=1 Tax=Strongyloides venezuelensis TaxID=75913 RepID=A0A0K0FZ19_STRVS